jgi:hypothetical protein
MRNLILVVVLLSLALVGCSRISQQGTRATGLDIALAVHPDPPGVGPCHLTINLTDAEGAPIDKAHLQIKGDMTHAGMKPVLAEVGDGEGGKYETPFEWTMGGDWIVTVTATLPDGRTAQQQFTYTVQGDMANMRSDDMQREATESR